MQSKVKIPKNKTKVHPPDRIKEKKNLTKEHYTGGQHLQILLESSELRCCPTPSICQVEGIFGQIGPVISGGLH
jgi:hypothetical protein